MNLTNPLILLSEGVGFWLNLLSLGNKKPPTVPFILEFVVC